MVLNQPYQQVAKERSVEIGKRLVFLGSKKGQEGRGSSADSEKSVQHWAEKERSSVLKFYEVFVSPSREYSSLGAFGTGKEKSNWKTPAAKASLWNPLPPLRGWRVFADFFSTEEIKPVLTPYMLFTALYITKPYLFLGLQHSDCRVRARQEITSLPLKLVVILLSVEQITWSFNAGKRPWAFFSTCHDV